MRAQGLLCAGDLGASTLAARPGHQGRRGDLLASARPMRQGRRRRPDKAGVPRASMAAGSSCRPDSTCTPRPDLEVLLVTPPAARLRARGSSPSYRPVASISSSDLDSSSLPIAVRWFLSLPPPDLYCSASPPFAASWLLVLLLCPSRPSPVRETVVSFQVVACADQAKIELLEVVDFLKIPEIIPLSSARPRP